MSLASQKGCAVFNTYSTCKAKLFQKNSLYAFPSSHRWILLCFKGISGVITLSFFSPKDVILLFIVYGSFPSPSRTLGVQLFFYNCNGTSGNTNKFLFLIHYFNIPNHSLPSTVQNRSDCSDEPFLFSPNMIGIDL